MAELRLENIGKNFAKTAALKGINLTIRDGVFCVILGPSGCGKSTLLNVIAGLEEPTQGKIYLGNKDITELAPHRRNMAMVFQSYALYPHLTAFENIAFGLRAKGEKKKVIQEKVEEVSRILNIEDKVDKFPRQLSGGQRQRVATGRAMVREPELFLFDEPLSNLDARLRLELRAEFIKLHQRLKKTIIYVTHDQIEAMSLGEEVVVLKDGVVIQVANSRQLYDNPANLFVAEFIGTPPMNILRLRLEKSADSLRLTKEDFILGLGAKFMRALDPYLGQEIYVGFRPSAITLDNSGPLKAEVIFTEVIGEDSFARISMPAGIELNLKISGQTQLSPGERVSIKIDQNKFYFFTLNQQRLPVYRKIFMKNNTFIIVYLYFWLILCIIALALIVLKPGSFLILNKRYWGFLFKPWKLLTFILAVLAMTLVAPYSGDPTWDYVDASFMSILTYFTAPWVVGVLYQSRKGRFPRKQLFVALCLWMFSASWSYDLYMLIKNGIYPQTWLANIVLSSMLYFCGGLFWNLDWKPERGVFYSFKDGDWPNPERSAPFGKIFHAALPYIFIVTVLCGTVIYLCNS